MILPHCQDLLYEKCTVFTYFCPEICFSCLLFVCLVIRVLGDTMASNEKVIQVDNFLTNVNLSESKVFYVRHNLDVSYHYDFNGNLNFHFS